MTPFSGATSNTTSRANSPGATTAGESANDSTADGEDGSVERHEQIDLTSGGLGEEDEDVLFEVKAKALTWEMKWVTQEVGLIRVLKHRSSPTTRPTPHSFYLIAAMDLAPPPVGELYVSDKKLIAAANTWAGAHDYALIISRSNKNKRGIKDKI